MAMTPIYIPDVPSSKPVGQHIIHAYAVEAITAGDAVSVDPTTTTAGLGMHVVKADQAVGEICIGGSLDTVAAGGILRVVVKGIQTGVNVNSGGAVAVGDVLVCSSTAGRLAEFADGAPITAPIHQWPVAVAMSIPSGNSGTVLWLGTRGFEGVPNV